MAYIDVVVYEPGTPRLSPETTPKKIYENRFKIFGMVSGKSLTYKAPVKYEPGSLVEVPFSPLDVPMISEVVGITPLQKIQDLKKQKIEVKAILGPAVVDEK